MYVVSPTYAPTSDAAVYAGIVFGYRTALDHGIIVGSSSVRTVAACTMLLEPILPTLMKSQATIRSPLTKLGTKQAVLYLAH